MFEIGSSLRQARERRRLGLDQAEAETKIRARYLRALEDEDFDLLPGPTYVKGFLRTYADYLGLDGQLFVDEYNSRHIERYEELLFPRRRSQPPRNRRSRREQNVVLVALAGIVAVAVLVIVAATYRPPSAPPPAPSVSTAAPAPPPSSSQLVDPRIPGADQLEQEAASTQAAAPKRVRLVLRAVDAPCYFDVWEGRGTAGPKVFGDTLDPAVKLGRSAVMKSTKGFTVRIACEPANASLLVNGKQVSPGSAASLEVRPGGAVTPYEGR